MTFYKWTKKKPKFNEDCIVIIAVKLKEGWSYDIFTIEDYDDGDNVYRSVIASNGDHWGDVDDLYGDKYYCMPLLKNKP